MTTPAKIKHRPHRAAVLCTPADTARAFGVSLSTVRYWRREGCPVVYAGSVASGGASRPRYDLQAVKNWLAARKV